MDWLTTILRRPDIGWADALDIALVSFLLYELLLLIRGTRAVQMALSGGFLLVLFLRVMRGNFLWWPFHPAGYALAVSYAMDYFWFCFFIAWAAKAILVRFGGMRAYSTAIPFFLGLILGDYVVGSLWALYGPIQHVTTYKIYI